MALHGTLVWLWKLVHLLNLVCSFQWCVLFTDVSDQTLAEQLNRDKDYYAAPVDLTGIKSGSWKSLTFELRA